MKGIEKFEEKLVEGLKKARTAENLTMLAKRISHELVYMAENMVYENRMQPIYKNKERFEKALGKAWESYRSAGQMAVDGFEDNFHECIFSKGFRDGYLFGLKKKK